MSIPSSRSHRTPSSATLHLLLKLCFIILILLLLPKFVHAKRRGRSKQQRKRRMFNQLYREKRSRCAFSSDSPSDSGDEDTTATCALLFPHENEMCIAKCLSFDCYNQVYGENPLEVGEVDFDREMIFEGCVYDELKSQQKIIKAK